MKRKLDPLETLLSRPEADLPAGLRQRTLERMGRRPQGRASIFNFARTRIGLPAAVCAVAVYFFVASLGHRPPACAVPASQGSSTQVPKHQARSGAAAKPAEGSGEAVLGEQAKAAPAAPLTTAKASALLSVPEQTFEAARAEKAVGQAPASTVADSLSVAHADDDVKASIPSHHLLVRGNRILPAKGQRLVIDLQSAKTGRVLVQVFNSQGRLTRTLLDLADVREPIHLEWDGRLADGQDAPSGSYVVVIQGPDKTEKIGALVVR